MTDKKVVVLGGNRYGRTALFRQQNKVVTEHDISRVMFESVKLTVHPKGRVLCCNAEINPYNQPGYRAMVKLYVEEPMEAAPPVVIFVGGFRDGSPIPMDATYVGSVFEKSDHAHIYVISGATG